MNESGWKVFSELIALYKSRRIGRDEFVSRWSAEQFRQLGWADARGKRGCIMNIS